jgi:cell wall-associated NlpC family hydrolase
VLHLTRTLNHSRSRERLRCAITQISQTIRSTGETLLQRHYPFPHIRRAHLFAIPFTFLLAVTTAVPAQAMTSLTEPVTSPLYAYQSEPGQHLTAGPVSAPTTPRDPVMTSPRGLDEAIAHGWAPPANATDFLPDVFLDAAALIGTPYIIGGTSPNTGFVCSSFTRYVWGLHGVDLINSATEQLAHGKVIPESRARLGDLIYIPGHVGFWAGPGWILDAPKPGGHVNLRRLWTTNIIVFRVG